MPRITLPAPNLDGLLVVVIRRWKWILATTLAFGAGVLLALPFLTVSYEISAGLLVKLGREQVAPPVSGAVVQTLPVRRTEDVQSELEILGSQALVERLVNELGVEYFTRTAPPQTLFQQIKAYARSAFRAVRDAWTEVLIWVGLEKRLTPFQRVVATLQASIRTEAVKRSDVITVSLLATDPAAGRQVLKRLIEIYQDEHIRVFKTPGATAFLQKRVDALRDELAAVEARRRAFGAGNSVWDFDEQHRQLLVRRLEAQQALARTEAQRRQVLAEIEQGRSSLTVPAKEQRTQRVEQINPAVQSLEGRIFERRAALATLRLSFTDDSERVREEEQQISKLEALLRGEKASVTQSQTFETSQARLDTERGLAERSSRVAGLAMLAQQQAQSLARIDAEVERVDTLGEQARRLQRDAAVAEQSYRLFTQRLDEARISDALDAAEISNVALIGEPVASVRPVRPRSMLLFLVALGAGALGSIGAFLLRDALRPVVHSRERAAQALGAPVLLRLPEVRR